MLCCPIDACGSSAIRGFLQGTGCADCSGKRKLTTKTFIKKAIGVHGTRYDYSKVKYVNNHTKVEIICPDHGSFWQQPNNHLSGKSCIDCAGPRRLTTKEFIIRAKEIHEDEYDYIKSVYVCMQTPIEIICPVHGSFWQLPCNHLASRRCNDCYGNPIMTDEEFIIRAQKMHGDIYDYSKVRYVRSQIDVIIICPQHGEFLQAPNAHLSGSGCKLCGSFHLTENAFYSYIKDYFPYLTVIHDKSQSHLYYPPTNCSKRYDFYFPELLLNIELDGKQHTEVIEAWGGLDGLLERQESDKWKDNQSSKNGIKVIRISYKDFMANMGKETTEKYFIDHVIPIIEDRAKELNIDILDGSIL